MVPCRPLHVQNRQKDDAGGSAKSLHYNICRVETEAAKDFQFHDYRSLANQYYPRAAESLGLTECSHGQPGKPGVLEGTHVDARLALASW